MDFKKELEQLIETSISEDIRSGDLTSQLCIPESATTTGSLVLKQSGVVAALPVAQAVFQKIDPRIEFALQVQEGSGQKAGSVVAKVSGPARGIVAGERVALNLLQHASGVATATYEFVRKLTGLSCILLDTRRTLPGLRALEKYAFAVAGGVPHRLGLDDRFVIKNNHLAFLSGAHEKPIEEAVNRVRSQYSEGFVEVEVRNLDQLREALNTTADAIMLNHMTIRAINKCVIGGKRANKRVYLKSSTITLDTIRAYAETGVDGIAIDLMSTTTPALDMVMRLE